MVSRLRNIALALAGSGAILALQYTVGAHCTKPSELEPINVMNGLMTLIWWIALVSSISFSFLPDDAGEYCPRADAFFTTMCCAGAVCFFSGIFTMVEFFKCELVDTKTAGVFAGMGVQLTAVVAAISLAWRAWKEPPSPSKTNEKLESAQ